MLTTCFLKNAIQSIMLTTGFSEKPVWEPFFTKSKLDIL